MAQSQLLQDIPLSCATNSEHRHSRAIQRQCKVFAVSDNIQKQWAVLKTFVVVERTGIRDGQAWYERQFYISSQIEDAQQLLADTIGHWGIENITTSLRQYESASIFSYRLPNGIYTTISNHLRSSNITRFVVYPHSGHECIT